MEYTLDTSWANHVWDSCDEFTRAYLTAIMWTLTDEDGDPCDELGLKDIAEAAISRAKLDCRRFQISAGEMIESDPSRAGADFWLTRNRHGAGFWDGDWPTDGDHLTRLAQSYGELDTYIDDEGLVRFF